MTEMKDEPINISKIEEPNSKARLVNEGSES